MKQILKAEEVGLFALSLFLFSQLDFRWYLFPLLLLTPDIGMVGYLFGPKIGALTYNLLHHRLIATSLFIGGHLFIQPILSLAGLIILAHISLDRIFGYGLKLSKSFKHTHLGKIG